MSEKNLHFRLDGEPSATVRAAMERLAEAIAEQRGDDVEGFRFRAGNNVPTMGGPLAPIGKGPIVDHQPGNDFCVNYSYDFGDGSESCTVWW